MRTTVCLFALTAFAMAQDPDRGAEVFRSTCAQGYCHGSGGTQGRAPKLIGRNFDGPTAAKIIADGVPNTGMPGFRQRLQGTQLDDVIAYVVKISGGDLRTLRSSASAAGAGISTGAAKGKALFFDALFGVDRCSTCHLLEGVGTAVGPNLASGGPYAAAAIRQGKPAAVRLATLKSGEKFPALVVAQGDWLEIYDLGGNPPVLRTVAKGDAAFSGGSPWNHAQATKRYRDADLTAIAEYLAWASRQ